MTAGMPQSYTRPDDHAPGMIRLSTGSLRPSCLCSDVAGGHRGEPEPKPDRGERDDEYQLPLAGHESEIAQGNHFETYRLSVAHRPTPQCRSSHYRSEHYGQAAWQEVAASGQRCEAQPVLQVQSGQGCRGPGRRGVDEAHPTAQQELGEHGRTGSAPMLGVSLQSRSAELTPCRTGASRQAGRSPRVRQPGPNKPARRWSRRTGQ
jgi:hypothetical protein